MAVTLCVTIVVENLLPCELGPLANMCGQPKVVSIFSSLGTWFIPHF